MALCDYFCCSQCDSKVIYDGYGYTQDALVNWFNIPDEDGWKIELVCHNCSDDGHIHIIPPTKPVDT